MIDLGNKLKTMLCIICRDALKPGGAAFLCSQMRSTPYDTFEDDIHLRAVIDWLCRAQDVCGGRGVSVSYHLRRGWDVAYPETSGYIIATFLAYEEATGIPEFLRRARELGDWEIEIQAGNGGVLSNPLQSDTRVFNTGQVLLGWCTLFERSGDERYLEAACRAGDYLRSLQEPDGSWQRDTYCGARTYHARVDWSLIRLARISGNYSYLDAAVRNLSWVVQRQNDNGWFRECGFNGSDPTTHVIVYTLRGLLESHLHGGTDLPDMGLLSMVQRAVDAICGVIGSFPYRGLEWLLPASFDANWKSRDRWSCLTGNAQFACLLFRLAGVTGEQKYRGIGERIVEAMKSTQNTATRLQNVRGGIGGAWPLHAPYCSNAFPNWAAKFFADALLMRMNPSRGPVKA